MNAVLDKIELRTNQPLITGEELYALGDSQRSELIAGKLKIMPPTGFLHGDIELNIGSILRAFVSQNKLGRVMVGEVGIYIQRNPDTIRGADVLYISQQRLAQVKSNSYLDIAPELIVEVLSPRDYWADINRKLHDYFSIKVDRVWIADPSRKMLYIYKSLTDITILQQDDIVTDDVILPNFKCKVSDFFN